jgi:hypothetical protein
MLMRYAAVTFLIAVLTAAAARAQTLVPAQEVKLSSMLAGAVTFTLPEGWHVSMYINTATNGSAEIINTKKVSDKPQARLFLSARFLPEEKTIGDMRAECFGSKLRKTLGGTLLSDEADGEDWRTVVWTADVHGKPHLMLEHFGVVGRKYVDLTAEVPLGSGDIAWMKQAVADFNAACESLKIDGRGSFEGKVSPDIITGLLKARANLPD